jgi:hypothetical protein
VIATTKPEVGTAALVDPDAISVGSPGLSLDAWRSAALINHADATAGVCVAKVSFAIVGGTADLLATIRVASSTA